ncbi:MAG: hypothetical protein M3393_08720 [Actinomycetota bacterium]|jgi:hypothetical protein|nr:hypothetical protein [Actinomycetota bacterium]
MLESPEDDLPVSERLTTLRRDYTPPFLAYLARENEAGLLAAYELGRQAMRRGIGLLDVVRVHNDVFLDVIRTARTPEEAQDLARAASAFLLETLASFEITQRGFMDGGALQQREKNTRRDDET